MPELPGLPPVPPPLPGLPPIPPPTGGTIEVMGVTLGIDGPPPPPPAPHSDTTPPGERPRRTRRTREQMEAARAQAASTTGAQVVSARVVDVPEEPAPQSIANQVGEGRDIPPPPPPAEPVLAQIPTRADNQHPRVSPIDPNAKPKFWASVGATINIGNYESMKFDVGVSGIEYDAPSEEVERIMASAEVGIHETIEALMIKVIDRAREVKIARGLPVGEDE